MEIRDPATEEALDTVPAGTPQDVERAVAAAKAAFSTWRQVTAVERAHMLHEAAAKMREHFDELARLLTLEEGKPLPENEEEIDWSLNTLDYYADYLSATTGSVKKLEDMLNDSERLYILQKLINLRQGKGTRASDRIPLRAMAPAFLNEYESRSQYYDEWLGKQSGIEDVPQTMEQKHSLLVSKRTQAFEQLCDIVYEKKGFNSQAVPKRETVEKFGLMDEQANKLLDEFRVGLISYHSLIINTLSILIYGS